MCKDLETVAEDMVGVTEPRPTTAQQACQHELALLERLAPQIDAIQLDQVEGAQLRLRLHP